MSWTDAEPDNSDCKDGACHLRLLEPLRMDALLAHGDGHLALVELQVSEEAADGVSSLMLPDI